MQKKQALQTKHLDSTEKETVEIVATAGEVIYLNKRVILHFP